MALGGSPFVFCIRARELELQLPIARVIGQAAKIRHGLAVSSSVRVYALLDSLQAGRAAEQPAFG